MPSRFVRAASRALTNNVGGVRGSALLRAKNSPQLLTTLLSRYYASKAFPPHTVINMPALSPTMTAGNIGTWQKQPGDALNSGDVLVEIETDKAQMDFEFQDEGVLAKILKDSGEKDISVGSPIAVFVDEGEDISAFADFTAADVGGDSKPAPPPKDEESKSSEPQGQYGKPTANSNTEQPQEMEGKLRTSLVLEDERFMASPLAKAIALEKGIALKNVKGTGEGGRITKADVERHQPSLGSASAGAASSVDFPLTAMRKTIASRLTESKNTNPHYYVQSSLSVGKLLKVRQVLNASANGEYKISVNDFFVKAVASALLKVPQVNSSYREAEGVIKQFNTADISVAVATPVGLMTPIIQAAHAKGLATISKDIKTLAVKARDGKLKPEEYQGGTFTISNMGMNPAVERFTAIINPPQAGILAIGAVKKVAVQGKDGGVEWDDQIVVSGSFDHRVADGVVAAEFIKELKKVIENPLELLL